MVVLHRTCRTPSTAAQLVLDGVPTPAPRHQRTDLRSGRGIGLRICRRIVASRDKGMGYGTHYDKVHDKDQASNNAIDDRPMRLG